MKLLFTSKANPLTGQTFHRAVVSEKAGVSLYLLCGKTLDISWLLSKGYRVTGAELSQIAIEQLFMELGVQPGNHTSWRSGKQWSAKTFRHICWRHICFVQKDTWSS